MVSLIVAVAVYVLILLLIAYLSLHPFRIPVFLSPGGLGCPQEDIEFTTKDGITLKGWWVDAHRISDLGSRISDLPESDPNTPPSAPTSHSSSLSPQLSALSTPPPRAAAIVSHGYMMNRSELSPLALLLGSKGIASIYYDFRAHGRSGGRKSYLGYREKEDVAAAVAFARNRYPGCKIVLIGSSMGAAASALAVGDDPTLANALVLDCAYSRLPRAVLGWWRFLGGPILAGILAPTPVLCMPMAGFNPYRVDVAKALARAGQVPVLFFHGDCDTLALPSEARRNQEACQGPTKIVWMPGCGHAEGRWMHPDLYNPELSAFLDEYVL